jgi:hypothetical protein
MDKSKNETEQVLENTLDPKVKDALSIDGRKDS